MKISTFNPQTATARGSAALLNDCMTVYGYYELIQTCCTVIAAFVGIINDYLFSRKRINICSLQDINTLVTVVSCQPVNYGEFVGVVNSL